MLSILVSYFTPDRQYVCVEHLGSLGVLGQSHCPELLDVDGDGCHHINNAAKVSEVPFSNLLEMLYSDLHSHHQWATDQVSYSYWLS